MKILHSILLGASFAFLATSCLKDVETTTISYYTPEEISTLQTYVNVPATPHNFQTTFKPQFQNDQVVGTPNQHLGTLGRVLFYDPKLSANDKVSCASCHSQNKAFSDNVAFSEGFEGELTERNSIALASTPSFGSTYNGGSQGFNQPSDPLFWDGRAHSVADQTKETLANPIEMGSDDLNKLAQKLLETEYYPILFRKAFGSEEVAGHHILEALEAFMSSLVSKDSKFDKALENTGFAFGDFNDFTSTENLGKRLYLDNCANCHGAEAKATNLQFANNGLDEVSVDKGFEDSERFKVPLLRNVELTAPYMHDGRFATLEAVIEHYSNGIQQNEILHHLLTDDQGRAKKFNFSRVEKVALVEFLKTLTDHEIAKVERFSDPF